MKIDKTRVLLEAGDTVQFNLNDGSIAFLRKRRTMYFSSGGNAIVLLSLSHCIKKYNIAGELARMFAEISNLKVGDPQQTGQRDIVTYTFIEPN